MQLGPVGPVWCFAEYIGTARKFQKGRFPLSGAEYHEALNRLRIKVTTIGFVAAGAGGVRVWRDFGRRSDVVLWGVWVAAILSEFEQVG
ncbi:hypothetical protein AKJ29_07120 [Aliiroseovarius crassostreae]|uniref:Uncharacterized protein n=1 Tax=Aliiroseovarius crassostreae TaxID=154981 RepID=A0A0P7JUA2_9RHOB|nr:hypothetical protein AKJ29_07120 [Aliiroseovarius crassostreae]